MKTLSTKGRSETHGEDSSYFLGWQEYEKNPYHHVRNPSGIIQMGLAENQLSFDLLESWLCNNPDAYGFREHGRSIFRELALFQDYHGLPSLKRALADFMGEIRGNRARFDPNKIVLTAGATSANEILMFCIADPGEAFLVPTPYYPGFNRDLKWRTGAEIVPIQCSSWNNFKITEPALEEAYQRARKLGLKVKGVLITNPSNPLGTTMTHQELHLLISFAAENNLHIISDEIYSGTVFDPPTFTSIVESLELLLEDRRRKPPAPTDVDDHHHHHHHREEEEEEVHTLHDRDEDISNFVHVVYSLSKDLGLPGFRVGLIYSNNRRITEAATKMSSFGLISSQTQHLISKILSDRTFTRYYIEENRRRIRKRKMMLVLGLEKAGIGCLKGNAGLFCWADMRTLLTENSFEAEEFLWKKMIYEVGLNVSPGSSCHCSEPGWFRICFANISTQDLDLALLRVRAFVDSERLWIDRSLTIS